MGRHPLLTTITPITMTKKGHTKLPFINEQVPHGALATAVFRGLMALGVFAVAYVTLWGDTRYVNTEEIKGIEGDLVRHEKAIDIAITHATSKDTHMTYQQKVELFLPRREFDAYRDQTGKQFNQINNKLDKLIDLQLAK